MSTLFAESRALRLWVGFLLGASFLLRLGLSARYFGFLTGDDVEILEAGLRWSLDLPYVPWEIRNTLLPSLLVAPMGALGGLLGISSPAVLVWLATVPFAGLSTLNILLTCRLVLALTGDRIAALLGGLRPGDALARRGLRLHRLPPHGFDDLHPPRRAPGRERCARTAAPLGRWRAGRARRRLQVQRGDLPHPHPLPGCTRSRARTERLQRAAGVAGGFVLGALLFVGLVDLVEWGRAFASLTAFFDYTFVERSSSSLMAEQPLHWYLWRALRWISPATLAGIALLGRRRAPWSLTLFVLVPVLLLSLVHHKELRYLQGVLPYLCAIGGIGVAGLWRAGWRRSVVLLVAGSIAWSAVNLRFLEKKSMAAVTAARYLAVSAEFRQIAAQQPWAMGDQLILGGRVCIRELSMTLAPEELRRDTKGMDGIVLYMDLLTSELVRSLSEEGLCKKREFSWGRSRPVALFAPCDGIS